MLVKKYEIQKIQGTTVTQCLEIFEHGEFLTEIPLH